MDKMKMRIKAIADYSWWTVGKIYTVQATEECETEVWYTILDDKGQKAELSSERHKYDFEML